MVGMTERWSQGDGSAIDRAWLADWRRRIATLYAEVRATALSDPQVAHAHWRAVRERLYREHPQSPVPIERRERFAAGHFDHDPDLRWELPIVPATTPEPGTLATELPSSGAEIMAFSRIGTVELPLPDGARSLSIFWMAGYAGGLFIPFRDATNGHETYPAGRYLLDTAKGADLGGDPDRGTIIVDLNFAYQPSCAFDPRWACPLAPPENRLDLPVRAGERLTT